MMRASRQFGWIFSRLAFVEAAEMSARTCFESLSWVEAATVARNKRHWPMAWRASKDRDAAILLGAVHFRWGIPVFESMPMGGYGGWSGDVDHSSVLERSWLARTLFPVVVLMGRPDAQAEGLDSHPVWPSISCRHSLLETHVLELKPTQAELLSKVKPSVRSYLRRVDQLGFVFSVGGLELLDTFMSVYESGRQNWLKKPASDYSLAYFHALLLGGNSEIWLVDHEGVTVGAAFFVKGAKDVLYIASGVKKVPGPVSPMDALVWAAILDFQRRGYGLFNMGASRGLESVRRFKEKFGARPQTYNRVVYLFPAITVALQRLLVWWRS